MVKKTVIETLEPEELTTRHHDAPKLLVEWSPRWQEFITSIRPAFSRSAPRLAGEAPFGILPYRNLIAALLAEAFLVFIFAKSTICAPTPLRKFSPRKSSTTPPTNSRAPKI